MTTCFFVCVRDLSCLTLCNPMDCSLPGSSVHGSFKARILEWVAISYSRGSSQPSDRTHVYYVGILHWQVDSLPLHHLGSPTYCFDDQAKAVTAQLEVLINLLYSPDSAPLDFHLFQTLQNSLNGKNCNSLEEYKRHLEQFFAQKDKKFGEARIMTLPENGRRQWNKTYVVQ